MLMVVVVVVGGVVVVVMVVVTTVKINGADGDGWSVVVKDYGQLDGQK